MSKQEKKEISALDFNNQVWSKIKKLEGEVSSLKKTLKPAVLPKQASLNDCNILARKAKVEPTKINPKLVIEESGVKVK